MDNQEVPDDDDMEEGTNVDDVSQNMTTLDLSAARDVIQDSTVQQLTAGLLQEALKAKSGNSLKAKLTEIWTMHLGSSETSFSDVLSVQHIGYILQKLAEMRKICTFYLFSTYSFVPTPPPPVIIV